MFLYHVEVHIIPFSVLITNRIGNSYFTLKNNRKKQHGNNAWLSTDAYNKTDVRGNVKALGCKFK